MHIHTNAMMLVRQYIIHIDIYMIYIPKKYREAQLVLINGRANGRLTPDLLGTRGVERETPVIRHCMRCGWHTYGNIRVAERGRKMNDVCTRLMTSKAFTRDLV